LAAQPPVQLIYVYLRNEGVDVWRPVSATLNPDGSYTLSANHNYDPEDEEWEFLPGIRVICEYRQLSGDRVLVAIQAVV
jgi:hypothetical protein